MRKILEIFKITIIIFFISIFIIEIIMRVFFGPPIRMQYDFTINRFDSHSDFIITYKYDFKNGYRDFNLKCNELEEKILIIGDSFGFGQGVKVENSLTKLLDKDYCVENWSMFGKDLKFIKYNLKQKKINHFKKIIIILFDNDTQIGYDKDKMKYAQIREFFNYNSFTYNFLKIFKKFLTESSNINLTTLVDGRTNNPANLFNKNSNSLKYWFDLNTNLKEIDKELNDIINIINENDVEIFTFVIPEPSVCSQKHRKFYSLHNAKWLPNINQRSDFDMYLEKKCTNGKCKYLPLYKDICNKQKKDGGIYFTRDFHLNSEGQFFLNKKLIKYLN